MTLVRGFSGDPFGQTRVGRRAPFAYSSAVFEGAAAGLLAVDVAAAQQNHQVAMYPTETAVYSPECKP